MERKIIGKKRAERLRNLNKRVSNKKSRQRVTHGLEVMGVETKTAKDFESIKEFNTYIRQMESFVKGTKDFTVKNKQGVEFKNSDYKDIQKAVRKINRNRAKKFDEIKHLPIKEGGTIENVFEMKHLMGDDRYDRFKPFKLDINKVRNKSEFEKLKNNVEKNMSPDEWKKKDQQYQDNFVAALMKRFNQSTNPHVIILSDRIKDMVDHVNGMANKNFMQIYYTRNINLIHFSYSFEEEQRVISELEYLLGMND